MVQLAQQPAAARVLTKNHMKYSPNSSGWTRGNFMKFIAVRNKQQYHTHDGNRECQKSSIVLNGIPCYRGVSVAHQIPRPSPGAVTS